MGYGNHRISSLRVDDALRMAGCFAERIAACSAGLEEIHKIALAEMNIWTYFPYTWFSHDSPMCVFIPMYSHPVVQVILLSY